MEVLYCVDCDRHAAHTGRYCAFFFLWVACNFEFLAKKVKN